MAAPSRARPCPAEPQAPTPAAPAASYAAAGVDLALAGRAKDGLRAAVASTATDLTLDAFGAFGGAARIPDDLAAPVVVASIDGVGTKLHLAVDWGRPADAGRDLVHHCINDVAVQNARPIAFLDYVASGEMDADVLRALVEGMAAACRAAGVAILGGETALMPDTYAPGRYDAVGAALGVVDAGGIPNASDIEVGDLCIGLPSTGLHTNGYSLARELAAMRRRDSLVGGQTLEDALMAPHRSYAAELAAAFAVPGMRAAAHITGGGIAENLARVLPDGVTARIDTRSWTRPPIFDELADGLDVDPREMFRVFNMGVGAILVAAPEAAEQIARALPDSSVVGTIAARGVRPVQLEPLE